MSYPGGRIEAGRHSAQDVIPGVVGLQRHTRLHHVSTLRNRHPHDVRVGLRIQHVKAERSPTLRHNARGGRQRYRSSDNQRKTNSARHCHGD